MRQYAIIGGGPRGLYTLESLFLALHNAQSEACIHVTIFESSKYLGAGWVWNPEQVDTNWLNITERALQNLPGRPEIKLGDIIIPNFPSYVDWLPVSPVKLADTHPDQFPPRAKLGTYLNARFETISKTLMGYDLLKIIKENVIEINYAAPNFSVQTSNQVFEDFKEIALTIGHQDTELSDQMKEWKEHTSKQKSLLLFTEAYPINNILEASISSQNVVALRGFGLATIDQLRALTIKKGGAFLCTDERTKELIYQPSTSHPKQFVPFSLDGLPMVPKPLNKQIDDWFKPSDDALSAFAKAVNQGACGEHTANDHYFLLESIAEVVTPIFIELDEKAVAHDLTEEEIYFLTINYIQNKKIEHEILLSHDTPTLEMMQQQVGMATGDVKITLDYCVGQIWRHCQPHIYSEFSYPNLNDEAVAEVIALDEASKRYSYGPPVESVQQIIALVKSGHLNLQFVNDPKIDLIDKGWQLELNDEKIIADVMINAVLDPPQLVKVNTPIIENLLENYIIEPKHTDLGIRTDDYGYVEISEDKSFVPLAVLGRLSKGSVIGVDAILECFGERITSWAEYSINQLLQKSKINE